MMNTAIKYTVLFLFVTACSLFNPNEPGSASTATIAHKTAISSDALFFDGIERDSLHSTTNDFYTDSMLSLKALTDSTFQVTNFCPIPLENVTITAELEGFSTKLEVITIDTVQPHTRSVYTYPTSGSFRSVDGKKVTIDSYAGFPVTAVKLDFLPSNDKLTMLKAIKMHWHVHFNDYSKNQPDHPGWEPIRPAQARLWTALLLNNTYLFSQDDYRERFLKEPFYHNVDSLRVVADSDWFTSEETSNLYYNNLTKKNLKIGIVNGYGLGGGSTLGISNGTLTGQFHYNYDDSLMTLNYFPESYYSGPHPLFSHELGHVLGFGHNSNVCSTGRLPSDWSKMFGFPSMNNLMYAYYLHYKKLPMIMEEYYRQDDFDYKQPTHGSAW